MTRAPFAIGRSRINLAASPRYGAFFCVATKNGASPQTIFKTLVTNHIILDETAIFSYIFTSLCPYCNTSWQIPPSDVNAVVRRIKRSVS
ncbi:MAG: hypothetical protein ACOZAA_13870 [Pseudomonadota bacterium]